MNRLLALSTIAFAAACSREAPLAPTDAPLLLLGGSPLSPLTMEYLKTETGPGTAQWIGNIKGDAVGSLRTRVLSVRESGHIWHIETLWEIDAGTHSFDAELSGTLDTKSGKLLLTGRIVSGMLVGTRVHDTGQLTGYDPQTGGTVFEGSLRIMTGSAGTPTGVRSDAREPGEATATPHLAVAVANRRFPSRTTARSVLCRPLPISSPPTGGLC